MSERYRTTFERYKTPENIQRPYGSLVIITGPTAAGKSTLENAILELSVASEISLQKVPLTTTRYLRMGEVPGIDMNYMTSEEFREGELQGIFGISFMYDGNLYAAKKKDLQRIFTGMNLSLVLPIAVTRELPRLFYREYDSFTAEAFLQRILSIYVDSLPEKRRKRSKARGDDEVIFDRRLLIDQRQEGLWKSQVEREKTEQDGGRDSIIIWESQVVRNEEGKLEETVREVLKLIRQHKDKLAQKDQEFSSNSEGYSLI